MEALYLQTCTLKDLEVLRDISRQTFTDAFASQNNPKDFSAYLQKAFSIEQLQSELLNPETSFYFLFDSFDKLVGYCKINWDGAQTEMQDPGYMELERIYVVREKQGRGLGKWMLDQICGIALKKHKKHLWLGVWEKNLAAIRFYQQYGFTTFDKHPYYIGSDRQMDWMMKIALNSSL